MGSDINTLSGSLFEDSVLRFDRTVDRALVHRASVAEVFLTDLAATGDDAFDLAAQLPRRHAFYRPIGGRYDTLLLAEVLRQSVIAVAHSFYDVPPASKFTMQALGLRVPRWPHGLNVGESPAELHVRFDARQVEYRGPEVAGLTAQLTFVRDGQVIATGSGDTKIFDATGYERLRWRGAGPRTVGTPPRVTPVAPGSVGVLDPADVVLGDAPGADSWRLRVDPSHPVLFDHGCDHVPGMLLLEGIRQAVRLASDDPSASLESFDARFQRFAELDEPVTVAVTPNGNPTGATVTCRQRDHHVADADVRVSAR